MRHKLNVAPLYSLTLLLAQLVGCSTPKHGNLGEFSSKLELLEGVWVNSADASTELVFTQDQNIVWLKEKKPWGFTMRLSGLEGDVYEVQNLVDEEGGSVSVRTEIRVSPDGNSLTFNPPIDSHIGKQFVRAATKSRLGGKP